MSRLRFIAAAVAFLACVAVGIPVFAAGNDAASGSLEIVSPWTSGGEKDALQALIDVFSAQNPAVEVINAAVGGGGGDAARPVLQTRLAGGNPPDMWQLHPGAELFGDYVDAGYLAPVTDLYEQQGWYKVMPPRLKEQIGKDGQMWSVLAGIHRTNVLWYNKHILDKYKITINGPITVTQFLDICGKLRAAGVTPIALGDHDTWPSAHIFELALVGSMSPDKYRGLWTGKTSFKDPAVASAVSLYKTYLGFVNADHRALSWDQAVKAVIEGKYAFTLMGDWSYGEFLKAGSVENKDFGWTEAPGSKGTFVMNADGFGLPKGVKNPTVSRNWLLAVGSKDGQVKFNLLKGSIPWRLDIDPKLMHVYQQWAMKSFASDQIVPTVVHGLAAPAAFRQALNDAVTVFESTPNESQFISELVRGASEAGIAN